MKKHSRIEMPLWAVTVGLVFSFLILGTSVKATQPAVIETGEMEVVEEENDFIEADSLEIEAEPEDYYLPYPGILPDNPFYWLKMIRDRIVLTLTTNPSQKAEKLLLYADKRLGAGYSLIDNDKAELGVTTLTKAEKYLEQANLTAREVGGEDLLLKLGKATRKHKEVLGILKDKVGDKYSLIFEQMIQMNSSAPLLKVEEVTLKIEFSEDEVKEYTQVEAKTAFELLQKAVESEGMTIKVKEYDFGVLVEEVDGKENTEDMAWIYYVNGESGTVAADTYELKSGDVIEWKYIKPIF